MINIAKPHTVLPQNLMPLLFNYIIYRRTDVTLLLRRQPVRGWSGVGRGGTHYTARSISGNHGHHTGRISPVINFKVVTINYVHFLPMNCRAFGQLFTATLVQQQSVGLNSFYSAARPG